MISLRLVISEHARGNADLGGSVEEEEEEGQDDTYCCKDGPAAGDAIPALDDKEACYGHQYQGNTEDITEPFPPFTGVIVQKVELIK